MRGLNSRNSGLLGAALFALTPLPAQAESRSFDLPAQDAVTAIPAFARQAGIQILVAESAARGRRTAAVKGVLPLSAALAQFLAGSGLRIATNDGRTVTLAPEAPPPPRPGAATAGADALPAFPLPEIVVTALRREEPSQATPAALAVVRQDALRSRAARDYADYLGATPGVTFAQSGFGAMRVTIRGVSDGIGVTHPLTGIYIDETPITESFQATLDPGIYDIDRIEVLKGPQGTLYGAGSMGGTVRIITRKPRLDTLESEIEAAVSDVAHGGIGGRIDGIVNVPLVRGRMALRASGGYRRDAGWIDDVRRGERNANGVEKTSGRVQLLITPGEKTSVILGLLYQGEDLGAPARDDLALPDHQTARSLSEHSRSEAALYSLTIRHDFEQASLTSASSYLYKTGFSANDATRAVRPVLLRLAGVSLGPGEGVALQSDSDFHVFSHELRLASRGTGRVEWLAGAFYSKSENGFHQAFDFTAAPSAGGAATGPAFYDSLQEYQIRQIAAFGTLTLNVTEALSLTAGLRVFDVAQRSTQAESGTLAGGVAARQQKAGGSSSTRKYLARYQLAPGAMAYVQASQGYRNAGATGGFPHHACAADLAAHGYRTPPAQYGPDTLWNYEIGSKNTLLNGRMTLNGAAFYIDWRNIQSSVGLPCGFSFIVNSGRAVSKGAELDATFRLSRSLTLAGALAYIDARIRQGAPGGAARAGDPLPLTARWSWNASLLYEREIGDGLTGFLRGEINHVGARWSGFRSAPGGTRRLGDSTTLALRAGVSGTHWSVALYGGNLTDERIMIYAPGTDDTLVGSPRVIGLHARVMY